VGWASSPYHWTIPPLKGNKKKSFIRVLGFDAEGDQVGGDSSNKPFAIKVVRETIGASTGHPTWEVTKAVQSEAPAYETVSQ